MGHNEGPECDAAQDRAWGQDAAPVDENAVLAKLLTRKHATSLYDAGKTDEAKALVCEALSEGMDYYQLNNITDLMRGSFGRSQAANVGAIGYIVAECITAYARKVAQSRGLL